MFSLVGNALCVNCRIVVNSWQILMLHRSGECSVAYLRPNMTTVPKISTTNMTKFTPPPRAGSSLVGCLVLQLVRRVRFPTLPLVMLTAMMLSMLSLASWGSKHPTRVLREPIQRVDLDWDRLNATQARTAARNPTSLTPNPTPVAGDPNPALTFLPRASAVCPSATSRQMRPREAGRGWASVRPASHVETVVKETTRTVR